MQENVFHSKVEAERILWKEDFAVSLFLNENKTRFCFTKEMNSWLCKRFMVSNKTYWNFDDKITDSKENASIFVWLM